MRLGRLASLEIGDTPWTRAIPFALLGLLAGLGAGFTIFAFVAGLSQGASRPVFVVPIMAGVSGAAGYLYALIVVEGSQKVVERIYLGGESPPLADYSRAETLAIRGHYDEAVVAFEEAWLACPEDPEPCLRLARLLRDELESPEHALTWFLRGRDAPGIDGGREIMATREIIDLYLGPLQQPRRALPELARLAERFSGTAAARWAAEELRSLKKELL